MKQYKVLTVTFVQDAERILNVAALDGYHVIAAFDVPSHFYMFTLERELTESQALEMREKLS